MWKYVTGIFFTLHFYKENVNKKIIKLICTDKTKRKTFVHQFQFHTIFHYFPVSVSLSLFFSKKKDNNTEIFRLFSNNYSKYGSKSQEYLYFI